MISTRLPRLLISTSHSPVRLETRQARNEQERDTHHFYQLAGESSTWYNRPVRSVLKGIALAAAAPLALLGVVVGLFIYTRVQTSEFRTANPQEATGSVLLVFGARYDVRRDRPSEALQNRLETALTRYQQGGIDTIYLSGDGREATYNEPDAMRRYLLARGVPIAAMELDPQGLSTLESCQNARQRFVDTQLILVTNSYHMPRAVYACRAVGLDAVGLEAANHNGDRFTANFQRELLATANLYRELWFTR